MILQLKNKFLNKWIHHGIPSQYTMLIVTHQDNHVS